MTNNDDDEIRGLRAKLAEATAACAEMRAALVALESCVVWSDSTQSFGLYQRVKDVLGPARALLARTDLGRGWVGPEGVGRLVQWTRTYGAALCPPGPDTYGEGVRAAKDQVRRILDTFLRGDG